MTHICVGNLTIIGSDNGLSPGRHQAIIWTNVGMLLIGPLGTNFSEILIEIQTISFKKKRLKVLSAKWRPFFFFLNEFTSGPVRVKYRYMFTEFWKSAHEELSFDPDFCLISVIYELTMANWRHMTSLICITGSGIGRSRWDRAFTWTDVGLFSGAYLYII